MGLSPTMHSCFIITFDLTKLTINNNMTFIKSLPISLPGRPTATSIAVVVNWTANFLVGLGFQPMQLLMGPWVFMVFIVIQLFFIVYVAVVVPETKGKTIDEITARFRK